jgi:KUP system potassium uptake protein
MFNSRIAYTPIVWQDSSFANGSGGKSRTGYVVLMCGASVAWGSILQPIVALSTMEAEYMSLRASTQEVMFLRQLLTEISVALPLPTFMMDDNKGCTAFAKNSMTTSKSKHINVKLHFVRDAIFADVIVMQWCSTHEMIADILTKFTLPGHQHARLASRMM